MREDIMAVKKEIKELKEQSFAMELLKDSKQSNKRMAIAFASVLVIVSTFWFLTLCYLIYTLNDINSTSEITTQEVKDIEGINGNIVNGGDINGDNQTNHHKN